MIRPRPLKSLEPGSNDWRQLNATSQEAGFIRNEAAQARYRSPANTLRAPDYWHPFKLYQLPLLLRVGPDPDTDWRRYRVRAGSVMGADCAGTDGTNGPAASNGMPDALDLYPPLGAGSLPDYLADNNCAQFWFWIEITGAGPVVRLGPDPTATSYGGGDLPAQAWGPTTIPWTAFPIPDAQHIPIAWVNTTSRALTPAEATRQLLRADIVSTGGAGSCPY